MSQSILRLLLVAATLAPNSIAPAVLQCPNICAASTQIAAAGLGTCNSIITVTGGPTHVDGSGTAECAPLCSACSATWVVLVNCMQCPNGCNIQYGFTGSDSQCVATTGQVALYGQVLWPSPSLTVTACCGERGVYVVKAGGKSLTLKLTCGSCTF